MTKLQQNSLPGMARRNFLTRVGGWMVGLMAGLPLFGGRTKPADDTTREASFYRRLDR